MLADVPGWVWLGVFVAMYGIGTLIVWARDQAKERRGEDQYKPVFYTIRCLHDGNVHVGHGFPKQTPWARERELLEAGTHPNPLLQDAWTTFGAEGFDFTITGKTKIDYDLHKFNRQWGSGSYRAWRFRFKQPNGMPSAFFKTLDEAIADATWKWTLYYRYDTTYDTLWEAEKKRRQQEEVERYQALKNGRTGVASVQDVLTGGAIYQIVNSETKYRYIGSAVDLDQRWRSHRSDLNSGRHPNQMLQRDWRVFGATAFRFEVLEYVLEGQSLAEAEQRWLDRLRDELGLQSLYNVELKIRRPHGRRLHHSGVDRSYS